MNGGKRIMSKRMREILAQIEAKKTMVKGYMNEETKDLEKATVLMDEIEALEKEYAIEKKLYDDEMKDVEENVEEKVEEKSAKASGFKAIAKMLLRRKLDDNEKALLVEGTKKH